MKTIFINENYEGIRLNKYLSKLLINQPDSFIYKMLRKKNILLNDKKAKGNELLVVGDKIDLYFSDDTYDKLTNNKKTIKSNDNIEEINKFKNSIIYEDDNIIIIDKWYGIKSQSDKKNEVSIDYLAKQYLYNQIKYEKQLDNISTSSIVNRLDTNTIGIIVFAKNYLSARLLSEAFRNRNIEKHYLALVEGYVEKKEDIIDLFMIKNKSKNIITAIDFKSYDKLIDKNDYYLTHTKYNLIEYRENSSLLDVELLTGRSHQIRVAMSYMKHPIVNDIKYGSKMLNKNIKSLALISYKIVFKNIDGIINYLNNKQFISKYTIL